MKPLKNVLQDCAHIFGLDVTRHRDGSPGDPLWGMAQLLKAHDVDVVLDVGANDGGYGSGLRRHGYDGRLISFEPLSKPFTKLASVTAQDRDWDVVHCAVGQDKGEVTINIAGNSGASSSVLPMLDRHVAAAPASAYVGTETVPQTSIDHWISAHDLDTTDLLYLKIDVQGYEQEVLRGAANLLDSDSLRGLQLELSFVPLYQGAMTWKEGIQTAEDLGMQLMAMEPVLRDGVSGQLLQADAVFFREQI